MKTLELTSEEEMELLSLLKFHQECLDGDDERVEVVGKLLEKVYSL